VKAFYLANFCDDGYDSMISGCALYMALFYLLQTACSATTFASELLINRVCSIPRISL
jgi:hypothetical protein